MKLLKYIFLSLAILTLSTACDEEFLEKQPEARLSDALIEEDEEAAINMTVNRLYGTLAWREWRIGWGYFITHEGPSGDVRPGGRVDYDWFRKFTFADNHWYLQLWWERLYSYIHYCNVVLEYTPDMEDRELAELAEAQAKFFRAYYNFEITNAFGEAPLRDHIPSQDEYDIPKSSKEEFYELIISDLEYAIEKLPTRSEWGADGLGRITKGTATGLLAKVYLFDQDYENAKKYAEQVINSGEYSLLSNYREVFSPDQLYSSENMMPGHYIFNSTIWSGRWYNPYLQHQGCAGQFGSGEFYPSDELAAAYESGDPRMSATLFTSDDVVEGFGADGSVTLPDGVNYLNNKTIWPVSYWNNGLYDFQNVNPMFMRYADILLIYAEASNELGQTSEALAKLEMIRYRARGSKTFAESVADGDNGGAGALPEITETDKAQLRELIWNERRIELALEGHRWYDLVRYNRVVDGYTKKVVDANTGGDNSFVYTKHRRFPIPPAFITSSNGILTQHTEW